MYKLLYLLLIRMDKFSSVWKVSSYPLYWYDCDRTRVEA